MSALTTRDALAKVIQPAFDEWLFRMHGTVTSCGHETEAEGIADAILASGAVIDATTLADEMRAMADVWGGDAAWLTTGTKVANLAAEWITAALAERTS